MKKVSSENVSTEKASSLSGGVTTVTSQISGSVGACSTCHGTAVSACSTNGFNSSQCPNYYLDNGCGGGTQCVFPEGATYCYNGGEDCGTQCPPPPSPPPSPPPIPDY